MANFEAFLYSIKLSANLLPLISEECLTIIYFIGATLDLQWMTAINQNHEKCTTEQIWWSSSVDSYL